jgi:ribosome modulation factor
MLEIDGASSGRSTDLIPYTDPDARAQEPGQVSRDELDAQRCTQRVDVEVSQILVEVSKLRRERNRLNRVHLRSVDQAFHRAIAGRIVVTDDIETA